MLLNLKPCQSFKVPFELIYLLKSNLFLSPTVEYNVYPYSEATERQLRFNYQLGVMQSHYEEPSYRNRMSDLFLSQALNIRYRLVESWGDIGLGSGFLHLYDTEHFYNLNFSPSVSWNILKGLNFNVQGSYSIVRDQYFLKLDDATSTEIITGQTQLKSAYNFFVVMGINYSFGSIHNNVVNVRFQGIY